MNLNITKEQWNAICIEQEEYFLGLIPEWQRLGVYTKKEAVAERKGTKEVIKLLKANNFKAATKLRL